MRHELREALVRHEGEWGRPKGRPEPLPNPGLAVVEAEAVAAEDPRYDPSSGPIGLWKATLTPAQRARYEARERELELEAEQLTDEELDAWTRSREVAKQQTDAEAVAAWRRERGADEKRDRVLAAWEKSLA